MVKSSSSKKKTPPSSSPTIRTFKGPNPTNPNFSPKSNPKPKRFKHVGRTHPSAIRRSYRLRNMLQGPSNSPTTPIVIDDVENSTLSASSQGEQTPIYVPFTSPLHESPSISQPTSPLSHASPLPSSFPIPSLIPSQQNTPASEPIPNPPDHDADDFESSDEESYVPDNFPSSEDFSVTDDATPSPPSSPMLCRRKQRKLSEPSSAPPSSSSRKFLPGKILGF